MHTMSTMFWHKTGYDSKEKEYQLLIIRVFIGLFEGTYHNQITTNLKKKLI
jgi:hypothetical protein